jgi:hypothetical protein
LFGPLFFILLFSLSLYFLRQYAQDAITCMGIGASMRTADGHGAATLALGHGHGHSHGGWVGLLCGAVRSV